MRRNLPEESKHYDIAQGAPVHVGGLCEVVRTRDEGRLRYDDVEALASDRLEQIAHRDSHVVDLVQPAVELHEVRRPRIDVRGDHRVEPPGQQNARHAGAATEVQRRSTCDTLDGLEGESSHRSCCHDSRSSERKLIGDEEPLVDHQETERTSHTLHFRRQDARLLESRKGLRTQGDPRTFAQKLAAVHQKADQVRCRAGRLPQVPISKRKAGAVERALAEQVEGPMGLRDVELSKPMAERDPGRGRS